MNGGCLVSGWRVIGDPGCLPDSIPDEQPEGLAGDHCLVFARPA